MDNIINKLRRCYSPDDLWVKSGKKACFRFLGILPNLNWSLIFEMIFKDMLRCQRKVGSLLDGEMVEQFFQRLTFNQLHTNEISENEYISINNYIENLSHSKNLSAVPFKIQIQNIQAQARLLKACLEIGRKRKMSDSRISVYKIMNMPIDVPTGMPINNQNPLEYLVFYKENYLLNYERIISSPEFHITSANYYGSSEYSNSVSKIAIKYISLETAFKAISSSNLLEEHEQIFIKWYQQFKYSAHFDWRWWL
jgi:hypothetical protein